jgi:hypothetical protein
VRWKNRPGIWFFLWAFEMWFWLSMLFTSLNLRGLQYNLSELFMRVFLYMCAWWITVYHVRWLQRLDEEQYKKQKEKDEKKS